MRYRLEWVGIVSTLFLVVSVFSQTPVVMRGRIADETGALIVGAKVRAISRRNEILRTVTTDSRGEFALEANSSAEFLEVSADGFASKRTAIGAVKFFVFELQPKLIVEEISVNVNYLAGGDEALTEIPGSVARIDRERLENSRVANFSEALRKVSGLNVRDEEGFGLRPNVGIRGTNPTRSSKILLLEDGIPLAYAPYGDNASYYHPPVERFESIEVLKGSGQIEYGPVTVSGVVNYITPNPPEKPTGSLKLIGGNRDFFNGSASYGATFGRTGFIVNFSRKQGAGARENTRSGLNDLSTKIVQTLNSRNILTAKLSYFNEDSRVTYSGLTESEFRQNARQNPFRNDSFQGFRTGITLQHTAILSAKTSITTNAYTNYFSRDWWRQSSNSNERPNRLGSDPDCRGMIDLNTTCGNQGRLRDYRTFGIEPKLTTQFRLGDIRNELHIGLRFHREVQERLQKNGDLPNSRDGLIAENNRRTNSAISGFVQNRFIWKRFALTPGLRIERIKFGRLNRLNDARGETEMTEVIPGLGITLNVFRNATIFAGVHRGFAPPRTEDIVNNSGGVVDLDAERSWNYETGIRIQPIKGISFDGTVFRTDYENQIVAASIAGGIGAAFTNGGKTLHQGFEFSTRIDSASLFKTKHNLYFQTSYTNLLDANFRGVRFSSISGFGNVSVTENRLPYAPKNLLNASLGYAFGNFDTFIENNFIGRQFADDLNTINPTANGQRGAISAQTFWNATANYKVEKLKSVFFVTAKNLFDRRFIVDRSRGILPSSPRLIQAGLIIKW